MAPLVEGGADVPHLALQARINPALTPEGLEMERKHFIEGLRRAGVPE